MIGHITLIANSCQPCGDILPLLAIKAIGIDQENAMPKIACGHLINLLPYGYIAAISSAITASGQTFTGSNSSNNDAAIRSKKAKKYAFFGFIVLFVRGLVAVRSTR